MAKEAGKYLLTAIALAYLFFGYLRPMLYKMMGKDEKTKKREEEEELAIENEKALAKQKEEEEEEAAIVQFIQRCRWQYH